MHTSQDVISIGYDVARDGVAPCSGKWENLTLIDGSITKDSLEQMENSKRVRVANRAPVITSRDWPAISQQSTRGGAGVGAIDGGKDRRRACSALAACA